MAVLFPSKLGPDAQHTFQFLKDFTSFNQEELTILYTYEDSYYFKRMFWGSKLKKFAWNKLLVFAKGREKSAPGHVKLRLRPGKLKEQITVASQKNKYSAIAFGHKDFQFFFKKKNVAALKNLEYKGPCLFINKGIKWQAPKNIMVVGGDLESLSLDEQQRILGYGIKYDANIHYINPTDDEESWSFDTKTLTTDKALYQKSFPASSFNAVVKEYIDLKKIDFIVVPHRGIDHFVNWIDMNSEMSINYPILVLKNIKKGQSKRIFDNFLPKTWSRKTTPSPQEDNLYIPGEEKQGAD